MDLKTIAVTLGALGSGLALSACTMSATTKSDASEVPSADANQPKPNGPGVQPPADGTQPAGEPQPVGNATVDPNAVGQGTNAGDGQAPAAPDAQVAGEQPAPADGSQPVGGATVAPPAAPAGTPDGASGGASAPGVEQAQVAAPTPEPQPEPVKKAKVKRKRAKKKKAEAACGEGTCG
ncbi:MAG: hypothetical protein B7733_26045 [Myxococcales bacterium FL481]|nr:MAG: hypothetical protein B7733_26045 [Myxococcales bacterium FL481]